MMVQSKSVTTVTQTTSDIAVRTQNGQVVIAGSCSDGAKWQKEISPSSAVALWRCCVGEYAQIEVSVKGTDKPLHLVFREKEDDWELCDGEALAFMNANQVQVLGWALKACATDAMLPNSETTKEIALSNVWVLSARSILTGDTTAEGADLIGGHGQVFSSEERARDALREFLRTLVNGAETESHWESSERNVDDVLDEILDNEQKIDGQTFSWLYDGLKQSFEVTLAKHFVDSPF